MKKEMQSQIINDDWIDAIKNPPTKCGLYPVKTKFGEFEAFVSTTMSGKIVWVVPDTMTITHWKNK